MRKHRSMDELVAKWVKATTSEQGKSEQVDDSETVAHLLSITRASRRRENSDVQKLRDIGELPDHTRGQPRPRR